MSKLLLLLGVSCFTSMVSAQTRVGSGVDSSPLQLDLVAPGIDLRSTDSLNVIQRIEDSSGKTWYIRQQGALFAVYPRGVNPNTLGRVYWGSPPLGIRQRVPLVGGCTTSFHSSLRCAE